MSIPESVFDDGTVPLVQYSDLRKQVKDGDLLLCSGNATFSKLIQTATHSNFSHVGFVMWLQPLGRLMVLESVESIGVRSVPLSSYLQDYNGSGTAYPGRFLIARHSGIGNGALSAGFAKFAIDMLGHSYDQDEIVRIAAHVASCGLLDDGDLQDVGKFICSEYVAACYRTLNVTITKGNCGFTAPSDFAKDTNVSAVALLKDTDS